MKENKFGILLTAFKTEDWGAYHKFSKSRYGEETDHQKVMDYIKKHKSRFDPKKMDTEYLRNKVRPDSKPIVFSNVISQLCKHIEAYFIWAEVMDDPMMEDTLLLQAYGKRGLTDQFHKQKEKSRIKREMLPLGLWNHYHAFMGEYLTYFSNMTNGISDGKNILKKNQNYLMTFKEDLGGYLNVEFHNRKIVLKEECDIEFPSDNYLREDLSINQLIYAHLIQLKQNSDHNSFIFLKNALEVSRISTELKYTLIIHLTSYCQRIHIKGDSKDLSIILKLYKYGIAERILFPNKKIPFVRFINIVNTASGLHDFKWAEDFVESHSWMVDKKIENEVKKLGYAQIEFSRGNFQKIIELLKGVKFKSITFDARARYIYMAAIYELENDNYERIEYQVNAFNSFLLRNKSDLAQLAYESLKRSGKYLMMISKGKEINDFENALNLDKKVFFHKWLKNKFIEKYKN